MSRSAIFCSYARHDVEVVRSIASDLDQLGQDVWFDQELTGGQSWWDTILEQIRGCDCFLFAISDASLHSKACRAELDYAHRLGRTILPVAVDEVIDQLLPPFLAETQRVPAGDTRRLARALLALPATPPLPDPLPDPPEVPITYLVSLGDMVDRPELTLAEQRNLVGELKVRLDDPDEAPAAIALLRRLRRHPSVNAWVADEIDTALAAGTPVSPPSGTPPTGTPLAPPSPAYGTPAAGTPATGTPASPAFGTPIPPPGPAYGTPAAGTPIPPPAPAYGTPATGTPPASPSPPYGTAAAGPDPGPAGDQRRAPAVRRGPPPLPPGQAWAPGRGARRSTGRRALVTALVVAVVLAAGGVAVWRLSSSGSTPSDTPTTEPVQQGGDNGGGQVDETTTEPESTETTDTTGTTDTTDPSFTNDTSGG